jgi:hypothetical protein
MGLEGGSSFKNFAGSELNWSKNQNSSLLAKKLSHFAGIFAGGLTLGGSMYYDQSISTLVQAAKVAAGVPENYRVEMSFGQLVEFLTSKKVGFTVRETVVTKSVIRPAQDFFFFRTDPRVEEVSVPAKEIEIVGVGTIPPFDKMVVEYGDQIVNGRLEVVPGSFYPSFSRHSGYRGSTLLEVSPQARDFLRGLMPVFRPELPEDLVELPMPEWVWSSCDMSTGEGGAFILTMFRSRAEQLAREFTQKLLQVTGDLQKVQAICERGKSGGDPFGYQQIAEMLAPKKQ